jgi:hypothetical protein
LINLFYSSEDFLGALGTDNDEVDNKPAPVKSVFGDTKVPKSNSDPVLAKRNKDKSKDIGQDVTWTWIHLNLMECNLDSGI